MCNKYKFYFISIFLLLPLDVFAANVRFCNQTNHDISYISLTPQYSQTKYSYKQDPVAYGWFHIPAKECRGVYLQGRSGGYGHLQWFSFVDQDYKPTIFQGPKNKLKGVEHRPEYACYTDDNDILDQLAKPIYLFGKLLGHQYPALQKKYCGKSGFKRYPVSFAIRVSGDVNLTLDLNDSQKSRGKQTKNTYTGTQLCNNKKETIFYSTLSEKWTTQQEFDPRKSLLMKGWYSLKPGRCHVIDRFYGLGAYQVLHIKNSNNKVVTMPINQKFKMSDKNYVGHSGYGKRVIPMCLMKKDNYEYELSKNHDIKTQGCPNGTYQTKASIVIKNAAKKNHKIVVN